MFLVPMRSHLMWAFVLAACSGGAHANGVATGDAGQDGGSGGTSKGGSSGAGGSNGASGSDGTGGSSGASGSSGSNGSGGTSGASDGGGGSATVVDWTESPLPFPSSAELRLVFPTYGATQATQLSVHGTAYQARSITVNGSPATLKAGAGDFSTWSLASFPLSLGDNVVTVAGTDTHGNPLTPVTVTVTRAPGTSGTVPTGFTRGAGFPTTGTILFGLAASEDGKYLYSSQGGTKGLYRIELSTGNGFETDAFASSVLNKTGVVDPTTSDVALVENGKYAPRLFGPDGGNALRYTNTDNYEFHSFWSAPAMAHLYNVSYHHKNDRLVLAVLDDPNNGTTRILSVDPSDPSSVEVLADVGLGLKNFNSTLLDEVRQRFYYATQYDDTGEIKFVGLTPPAMKGSVHFGTTETPPRQIEGMATCGGSPLLYVLEEKGAATGWNRISAVDVTTGNRHTLVDSPSTGTGVPLVDTRKLICAGGVLFASLGQSFEAMDPGCSSGGCPENKIVSIDPETGDRLVVSFINTNTQAQIPGK
jgi:hypothetical protein